MITNVSVAFVMVVRDIKLPQWTYPFLFYIQVTVLYMMLSHGCTDVIEVNVLVIL